SDQAPQKDRQRLGQGKAVIVVLQRGDTDAGQIRPAEALLIEIKRNDGRRQHQDTDRSRLSQVRGGDDLEIGLSGQHFEIPADDDGGAKVRDVHSKQEKEHGQQGGTQQGQNHGSKNGPGAGSQVLGGQEVAQIDAAQRVEN